MTHDAKAAGLIITGIAAMGDLRSKLKIIDEEVVRHCEIPLDIQAPEQAREILRALHVGELCEALFDSKGGLRMPYFSEQAVSYALRNLRMEIGFASASGAGKKLMIPRLDLHKMHWRVEQDWGLHLTCRAQCVVTADQWLGLWELQPYTGLAITLSENQSALSLEAA